MREITAALLSWLESINHIVGDFLWSPFMLAIFLSVGAYFTLRLNFFQFRHIRLWFSETIVNALRSKRKKEKSDSKSISQFQAMTTALAASMGTGNIVGVATAITLGGPGAIFWMWVSSLLGMMTTYAENVLGIRYRYKDKNGEWIGGAMIYIERGLGNKVLAVSFAIFCLAGSLGVGNMTQSNSIAAAMQSSFSIPPVITGIVIAAICSIIIMGGLKRIAVITEKIIPVISLLYLAAVLIVVLNNIDRLIPALQDIVQSALSPASAGSGVLGYGIAKAARYGISRGVFSNEAGLGTSVAVHASADVNHPSQQGFWAIFEILVDTIIMCTLTALAILVSGVWYPGCGVDGGELCAAAFKTVFGDIGVHFISISILMFAFSTIIGWSFYGERCARYIGGDKLIMPYRIIFIAAIFIGSVSRLQFVWELSDTFNGLMSIPNLIAVCALSGTVIHLTKEYLNDISTGHLYKQNKFQK